MDISKIQQIIKDKNEQRERVAVRTAEDIIESIIKEQHAVTSAQERIKALREELAKLQVEQIDQSAILGGL